MEVILNKIESLRRCLKRIRDEYDEKEENLFNFTKQDSIILNLQRACELCIDMGNYLIAQKRMETPRTSREVFEILKNHQIITAELSEKLQRMVGFRNIAIHNYQEMDMEILKSIINSHLVDFEELEKEVMAFLFTK